MKKTLPAVFAGLVLALGMQPVTAPAQMNYQGRLTDPSGSPLLDGQFTLSFSLYAASSGGTAVWGPFTCDGATGAGHAPKAELVNGRFNVVLGAADTAGRLLTAAFVPTGPRYLGIKVGPATEISPRQQILAAPEAIHALLADTVPRGAIGTDQLADGSVTVAKLQGGAGIWLTQGGHIYHGAGNVGIGTTGAPLAKLEIQNGNDSNQNALAQIALGHRTGGYRHYISSRHNAASGGNAIDFWLNNAGGQGGTSSAPGTGNSLVMSLADGIVGIGTAAPNKGKLEVNGGTPRAANFSTLVGYMTNDWILHDSDPGGTTSIWASNAVTALEFVAVSDERVKIVRGLSDSAADLKTLRGIGITNYTYRDTLSKGSREHKKVIAQQVETVFPQAVRKSTDVIPDIFKKAPVRDGWVDLATDLKKGERVRLITDGAEGIHEVMAVEEGRFLTGFKPAGGQVFVYGREVNDFRTVDYEAIAMLNVSATQEIQREVERADAQIKTLREDNAGQATQLRDMEAKAKALAASNEELTVLLTRRQARDEATQTRLAALEKALSTLAGTDASDGLSTASR